MDNAIYLTADGIEKVQTELDFLTTQKRPEIAKRLRAAIEMGDLSEMPITQYQRGTVICRSRILELEHIVKNVVVIEEKSSSSGTVEIGSEIIVREEGYDDEETFYIVGSKEADPIKGKISYESPIGKSLLKHHIGEIVRVSTPGGDINFKIMKIK
jgi:transcription elongation factor GreA